MTKKDPVKDKPDTDLLVRYDPSVADAEVEKALFKRACGYKSIRKRVVQNPDGTTHIEILEEEVPPDVAAQKFWLKNHRPKEWIEG